MDDYNPQTSFYYLNAECEGFSEKAKTTFWKLHPTSAGNFWDKGNMQNMILGPVNHNIIVAYPFVRIIWSMPLINEVNLKIT